MTNLSAIENVIAAKDLLIRDVPGESSQMLGSRLERQSRNDRWVRLQSRPKIGVPKLGNVAPDTQCLGAVPNCLVCKVSAGAEPLIENDCVDWPAAVFERPGSEAPPRGQDG